jgi:hypothetical protein
MRVSYGNLKHPSHKSVKRARFADDLGFSLIKELLRQPMFSPNNPMDLGLVQLS